MGVSQGGEGFSSVGEEFLADQGIGPQELGGELGTELDSAVFAGHMQAAVNLRSLDLSVGTVVERCAFINNGYDSALHSQFSSQLQRRHGSPDKRDPTLWASSLKRWVCLCLSCGAMDRAEVRKPGSPVRAGSMHRLFQGGCDFRTSRR